MREEAADCAGRGVTECRSCMHPRRQQSLQALGFEFDGERAEWLRWYEELKSSTEASMLGTGRGADFYLYNWCCPLLLALCPAQHAALPTACRAGHDAVLSMQRERLHMLRHACAWQIAGAACSALPRGQRCWRGSGWRCWMPLALTGPAQTLCHEATAAVGHACPLHEHPTPCVSECEVLLLMREI